MAAQDRHLTIEQETALRWLAFVQRTNLAEQRRRAIRDRADQALEDPACREFIGFVIECQIKRAVEHLTEGGAS